MQSISNARLGTRRLVCEPGTIAYCIYLICLGLNCPCLLFLLAAGARGVQGFPLPLNVASPMANCTPLLAAAAYSGRTC